MCFTAALERTEVFDPVNQRAEHLPQRCELLVLKSESLKNKSELSILIISFDKCFFCSALLHPVSTTGIHQLHWSRRLTRDLSHSLASLYSITNAGFNTVWPLRPQTKGTITLKFCGKQALWQYWFSVYKTFLYIILFKTFLKKWICLFSKNVL